MSEDLLNLVQSLIKSGEGDLERLQSILASLQSGNPLQDSDKKYLQDLRDTFDSRANFSNPPQTFLSETNDMEESRSDLQDQNSHAQNTNELPTISSRKKSFKIITIVSIIVICYVGLDVYSAYSLQFRPHLGNQYLLSQTQLFIQSDVCNTSYFPAYFKKYEINAFYKNYTIEKAEISGSNISPKTYEVLNGIFTINKDALIKLQKEKFTFDPTQAHVTTTIDSPIFGVIPFSISKEYTGEDFQRVVKNGVPGSFNC